MLRANFNFKLHRLDAAENDLRVLDAATPGVEALRADLAFHRGRYDDARRGYAHEVELAGKWDDYARLAYLQSRTGDFAAADRSYAQAEEQISVKEMRSYAWVELQRGLLSFERGRYEDALAHYRKADRAYSGYWLIEEHIAEVLDRLGKRGGAIAMYEKIIARTHNPEYVNALARSAFDAGEFHHYAPYVVERQRIEMWLVARRALDVDLGLLGGPLKLARSEGIRTEISRRFTREQVLHLLDESGFAPEHWFESPDGRFGLALGRARASLRGL